MKANLKKHDSAGLCPVADRGYVGLDMIKAQALRASASARNVPVSDVREAFGFMPVGIEGVVIRWPLL